MTTVSISQSLAPRIQAQYYTRNGQVAPGISVAAVAEAVNQCAALCGKELVTLGGNLGAVAASGTDGSRFRSRFHTGPFCDKVQIYLLLARPDGGDPLNDAYATFELQNTSGTLLDSFTSHWAGRGSDTATPDSWGLFGDLMDVAADTDYQIDVKVFNSARVANVLVFEVPLAFDTANGYVAPPTDRMLDDVRGAARLALYNLYRRACAVVASWSGSRTNATATDTNIIDGTSTTVATTSPGFTLDMRYKARQKDAATGVNCQFFVYGSASVTGGSVKVKNSAGTTLATVSGFTTTPGWKSVALVLPASLAKYDITLSTAVGALTITDAAIYEHET